MHWRKKWQPTPVFLPGESQGRGSLMGCRLWSHTESDMTERLHFHFSLSCIGGRNGSPLQCSCLENPRDGGAWWAAVYGVAQGRTRLKRLSSSPIYSHLLSPFCWEKTVRLGNEERPRVTGWPQEGSGAALGDPAVIQRLSRA